MHPHKQELDLPALRRELEELLAMVTTDLKIKGGNQIQNVQVAVTGTTPINNDIAVPHTTIWAEPNENNASLGDRDLLSDDALVVITEFGHASAAILQMWLSIDYGRAIKILNQFQADGLISAKGRVRHKAFVLRHSLAT
jgi:DNA segregation ATPase FtsK/SpoIIIE-like protein